MSIRSKCYNKHQVQEYKRSLKTDAELFPMLKTLKLLRAIVVNIGIFAVSGYDLPPFSFDGTFEAADESGKSVSLAVSDIPVPEDLPIFDLSLGEYGEWTIESDGGSLDTFTINP